MWADYVNLHVGLFYTKIYGIQSLTELLYYRNKLLDGSYSKQDYLRGYSCLNEEQEEAFLRVKQQNARKRITSSNSFANIIKSNRDRRQKWRQ